MLVTHLKPEKPYSLSALRRADQVVLHWEQRNRRDVSEYRVFRKSDGEFGLASTLKKGPFIDNKVTAGSSYWYMVQAVSPKGVLSEESDVLSVGADAGLAVPHSVSFETGPDSVWISWEHPEEGVLFNVYRRIGDGKYAASPVNTEPLAESSMSYTAYFTNTVSYTVRAVRRAPEVIYEGPPSGELAVRPGDYVPAPPTGLEAVRNGNKVVVIWRESPEPWVRGYAVYRKAGEGGEERIGVSDIPTLTDTGVPLDVRLAYRVRAMGPVAEGLFSDTVVISPVK
jgi:fibronectin type 3 domain-containing protein